MVRKFSRFAQVSALALTLLSSAQAPAQVKGIDEPFREEYRKTLAGKVVGYIPVSLGADLARAWYQGLKSDLEPAGMRVVLRDPNADTNAAAQAFATLMAENPAVIVVQNPDLQTHAKLIARAEAQGIYVVQVNMSSARRSTAFVGVDWVEVGERGTDALVQACQGKSNKIAIVQGPTTAAGSTYTLKGIENMLAKNPQIQVVSNQAGDWDAAKAKGLTQTVLKQHPDLCGIIGFWDGMDIGIAAAVREAGLTGKVFLVTSGSGEQKMACDQVKSGAFDLYLSYDAPKQAVGMAAMIKWLVQGGVKAGSVQQNIYSTLTPITKENANTDGVCWTLDMASN